MSGKWKRWKRITMALIVCAGMGELVNALPKPALGLAAANPAAQVTPAQDSASKRKRPLVGTTGPRFSAQGALTDVDSGSEALVIQSQNGSRMTVLIDDHTQIFLGGRKVSLGQLKPGARVSVRFFQMDNALVADEVEVK
jgi:hypothetical protein